jgi:protein pelota
VVYGYKHVLYALTVHNALETLLVLDSLFRSTDLPTRKKYVQLVEQAREAGAEVIFFSAMHVTGEQLGQLSGVAATLRFPIADLDEQLDDDEVVPEPSDVHIKDTDSAGSPQDVDVDELDEPAD